MTANLARNVGTMAAAVFVSVMMLAAAATPFAA